MFFAVESNASLPHFNSWHTTHALHSPLFGETISPSHRATDPAKNTYLWRREKATITNNHLTDKSMNVRMEESWKAVLSQEFEKFYFETLTDFVRQSYATGRVYPPAGKIFRAFDSCPFHKVRVVILGQDPYHEPGQAEGLAFSVPEGVMPPPSLRNILKEVESDLGRPSIIRSGHLGPWVEQGVLLLNATLTVAAHHAASHQNKGWETFTDAAIEALAKQREGLVFMLWGSSARRKAAMIPQGKHAILEAPHPSPLSAARGFLGCKHFSKANQYLIARGEEPVNW